MGQGQGGGQRSAADAFALARSRPMRRERSAADDLDEVPAVMTRELWNSMSQSERLRWVQQAARQSSSDTRRQRELENQLWSTAINRGFDGLREVTRAVRDVRIAEINRGGQTGLELNRQNNSSLSGPLFNPDGSMTAANPQYLSSSTSSSNTTMLLVGAALVYALTQSKGRR